jgi:hypothetical protein
MQKTKRNKTQFAPSCSKSWSSTAIQLVTPWKSLSRNPHDTPSKFLASELLIFKSINFEQSDLHKPRKRVSPRMALQSEEAVLWDTLGDAAVGRRPRLTTGLPSDCIKLEVIHTEKQTRGYENKYPILWSGHMASGPATMWEARPNTVCFRISPWLSL